MYASMQAEPHPAQVPCGKFGAGPALLDHLQRERFLDLIAALRKIREGEVANHTSKKFISRCGPFRLWIGSVFGVVNVCCCHCLLLTSR